VERSASVSLCRRHHAARRPSSSSNSIFVALRC